MSSKRKTFINYNEDYQKIQRRYAKLRKDEEALNSRIINYCVQLARKYPEVVLGKTTHTPPQDITAGEMIFRKHWSDNISVVLYYIRLIEDHAHDIMKVEQKKIDGFN